MKRVWKMLIAALLTLVLFLSVTGSAGAGEAVYGVCTANSVRIRKQPSTSANVWFYVDKGFVAEILDVRTDNDGNVAWYKVNSAHPVPNGRTYIGYIHADFFRELTEEETRDYLESNATPAPDATLQPSVDDALQNGGNVEYTGREVVGAKGRTTASANFRTQPTTKAGEVLCVIPARTLLEVTAVPLEEGAGGWYRVRYDGQTGYVYSGLMTLLDAGATPTPAPGFGTEVTGVTGVVTAEGVNFRTEAGLGDNIIAEMSEGTEVEILTVPDRIGADHWYRVRYNGTVGYIQSNFIRVLENDNTQTPSDPEENTPITATGAITADGVSFRIGAGLSFSSMGQLNADTVVELLYIPDTISPDHWYRIRYNNREGYVQANFIRLVTVNEDDLPMEGLYGYAKLIKDSAMLRAVPAGKYLIEWKGKGTLMRITGEAVTQGSYDWYPVYYTVDSTIYYVRDDLIEVVLKDENLSATATPAPVSPYGYVITTATGVNLRIKPGGESIGQVPRNTVLACVGEPENPADSDYTWYYVKYKGMYGYLRGDCVRVCTATGGEVVDADAPTATPDPSQSNQIYGYIKLIKDGVNLRVYPQKDSQAQLPRNLILPVVGAVVPEDTYGRYCWYPVRTADGLFGYIRGDCAMLSDADGNKVETTPAPDSGEIELTGATGVMKKNANFRKAATTEGGVITVIPANTVVEVLTIPVDASNGWYKISYQGEKGYVHASLITVLTNGDTSGRPTLEPFGYVMMTGDQVNVRKTPNGTSLTKVNKSTVWPVVGLDKIEGSVTWYCIRANGQTGYVPSTYAFRLSPEQEESYLAGNGVPEPTLPPEERPSSYLITTSGQLNIRESYSQDSTSVGKVSKGVVMAFVDTQPVGTTTWYKVVYDHVERWVHGGYIDVMTVAEYQAWLLAHPDALPDLNSNLGYLKTVKDNVYIRNAANGSLEIDQVRVNTVMRYYTDQIGAGGTLWYQVLTPGGEFGYIRSDMVVKCDENGEALPTTGPGIGDTTSAPGNHQETTYSTLKLGDGGEGTDEGRKVANLVQELINQGYYNGTVTSDYTTQVYEAVKAFQSVKGLTVDGIAGEKTQHALYGTVKVGQGDRSNLDFTIYPVEKIDWFTGGIQQLLPRDSNFKVLDLKTGIVWWAHRWAGSKHADIETLTAADTARLCQIYGVDDAQEIYDKNMWHRRPCLVTIGTRTFACSLDGMPHNPDGDTIKNNNMTGQICLHFTNSTGHSPGAPVSTSHAEAIEWAYNNCPAGKK